MRRIAIVVVPLVVILALAAWRALGPAPKPVDAPAREFSAGRAMGVLGELLAEGVPHPVATEANARVRDRILARFAALGYDARIQRRFACNASAMCAVVENIIAETPDAAAAARGRRDTVLLMAHYDSVAAGPGASDDGMGVAALLEVARAIRGERFRNPVRFLITDGEEAGIIGAEAFLADESLSRDIAVVINLENRGTYGVSNMFETSRGNRWIVRHLAGALERPAASSLFYSIYDALPNDTDVTVFKRAGKAAINFAGVRGVNWYHTPLDDVAHASARTMQHHGDNALATARAFADADVAARSRTDATYFDVLGFALVWWPQEWTLWLAIVSLVLFLVAARKEAPRTMTFGVLAAFTAILLALLIGVALAWLARLRSGGINWVAYPQASIATMWLSGIAAALFGAAIFNRRDDARAMLYGAVIVWHVIGIAVALTVPGAAFLFVVPAVAAMICALAGANETVTAVVASSVAALSIFPLGLLLYEALGAGLMAVVAVFIGIVATLVAPLFARARNGVAVAVLALVCAVIALALPPYTDAKPRFVSLSHVDDPVAGSPLWITGTLTEPLRNAATFAPANAALAPWHRRDEWAAPAPPTGAPRVTMTAERTSDGVMVRVRSPRRANRLILLFRGGTIRSINGVTPPPRPSRYRARTVAGWEFATANGVDEMIVEIAANAPVEAIAQDVAFGLPPAGAALVDARNASPAVPYGEGDVTITRARGKW